MTSTALDPCHMHQMDAAARILQWAMRQIAQKPVDQDDDQEKAGR